MADTPTAGVIDAIIARERCNIPTALQLSKINKDDTKYRCTFTDGDRSIEGYIAAKLTDQMDEGCIETGGTMRIMEYVCNEVSERGPCLAVFKFEVITKSGPSLLEAKKEPLAVKMEGTADNLSQPTVQPPKTAATPGMKENAAPYHTPVAKAAPQRHKAPNMTPPSTGHKNAQPIQALNPYNNQWTIKARVSSKAPLRSMNRNGQSFSVFSISLVDEQGSEIEATLWRAFADQWYDNIKEGKVYLVSKGRVKPANKAYTSTRNDYAIDLGSDSLIEECPDEDPGRMKAKACYTKLDALPSHIGKKMLVDVLGIVKEVQLLGTVKRKSDGVDLPRRDLVLADQSGKTVRLTIWGSLAATEGADLEGLDAPIVSVTAVRVGDYDGVSLSTVSRSTLQINPDSSEADSLRSWWESGGSTQELSHAGSGISSSRKSLDGRSNERALISSILKDPLSLPAVEAKPEYFPVRGTIMTIDPDQTPFFYTADAATGKKVVQADGQWRLAADDSPCNCMERRYFLRVSLMDESGSCEVLLNNDQGESLLGRKAEEMFDLRETDRAGFQAVLSAAQFTERAILLRSNTTEYKGDLRQRVQGCGKFSQQDWSAGTQWLLSKISGFGSA